MNQTYRERPQQPLCKFEEIQWEGTKLFQQGMVLWACWPVENEPLMWQIAQCHVCRRAPAHWVGVGDPFNDGGQYFCENAAFCYWCFPRRDFSAEELRLVRHAEWARTQTTDEIIEIVREASNGIDNTKVREILSNLADNIREATKQEVIYTPEEVAAFLSDMTLDEWRKATSPEKRKACPDSEGLGFWGDERFTVGYVDEVNGPNSAEMPEFVPTLYELIQLAKYWATIVIDLRFDYFLYTGTGSSEWRLDAFANRRVGRIGKILGQDEINKVIDQAYKQYGKEQDPRAWSIFLNGTPEEQEAFQDEVQEKICEQMERADRSPLTPEELSKFDVEMLSEAA